MNTATREHPDAYDASYILPRRIRRSLEFLRQILEAIVVERSPLTIRRTIRPTCCIQCESHHVFTKVFVVTRPVFKQTSV